VLLLPLITTPMRLAQAMLMVSLLRLQPPLLLPILLLQLLLRQGTSCLNLQVGST
jgi:hypothetical protein